MKGIRPWVTLLCLVLSDSRYCIILYLTIPNGIRIMFYHDIAVITVSAGNEIYSTEVSAVAYPDESDDDLR